MAERPVLTARLSERTLDRLETYAEKEGMSKSKAADNMIRQGLDVQESDMRLVPVKSDGGTVIEDELEHTQNQVGEISEDVDKLIAYFNKVGPPLLVAILWVFLDQTVGIPGGPTVAILSGIGIALWLITQYIRVVRNE